MNLKDLKETYEFHTGMLSSINRQLAFAGIAIVWIFTEQTDTAILLDKKLLLSVLLFFVGLGLDVLQYLYQSIIWWCAFQKNERRINKIKAKRAFDETKISFNYPYPLVYIPWIIFFLKVSSVISAYIFLIIFLIKQISF